MSTQTLIANAFDTADMDLAITPGIDRLDRIAYLVKLYATDRRYSLKFHAVALGSRLSATVSYRGRKYHVWPQYAPGGIFTGYTASVI